MERKIGIGIEGTGLALMLASIALDRLEVQMPQELAYTFLILAGIALVGGWVLGFRWAWLKSLVGQYRFQPPIVRKTSVLAQSGSEDNGSSQKVSEHIARHIQSVTEQLVKVSAGAYSCSVKQILDEILADNTFSTWYRNEPRLVQLVRLLHWQLDQLFDRAQKCREKSKSLTVDDLTEMYKEIGTLTTNYRSIASEFIQLLNNLEKEGAPTVWNNEQLSSKIYRELQDNYDELMDRIKRLNVYVATETRHLLPSDEQLTKFARIPGAIMS